MSGDPVLDALTAALDSPERAVEILQTARSTIPGAGNDPRLLLSLSRAHEAEGRLKDAVEPVQALLGAHPNLAAGWARLGGVFLAGGAFAQAEQALARAIELDPDDADIRVVQAEMLTFAGRLEEARSALDVVAKLRGVTEATAPERAIVIPVLRNDPGGKHDVSALLGDLADFEGEVIAVFNDADACAALKDHPRLTRHALCSQNVGVGRAWNIGLNLAEGPVVFVLNSDLRIDDLRCLSDLEAVLIEEENVALAGVAGELIDPETLNPTRTLVPGGFEGRVTVDSVQGHFFGLHADRFAEAGLSFDPRLAPFFCEEIDIGRQARRAGLAVRAVATDGWRHAVGISRTDYPVRYLGRPVDRDLALLGNRIQLREKWRRQRDAAPRGAAVASGKTGRAPAPEPAAKQSAADRAEDHYYLYSRPEVRALVPKSARRVLDIGCGAGALGAELKKNLGCEVWGVEFQADVADQARSRLDHVLSGDVFRLADQLPSHGFDTVILADVLEHVIDGDGLLGIVKDKLAPGGRLVMSLPNIAHWSIVVGLMQGQWEYAEEGLLDRTHLRFFTPASANGMLARNGFTPEIATGKTLPDIAPPAGLVEALKAFDLDVPGLPASASVYQMLFVCRVA
ncbi:MAG: methyltransferase domain-containing protein [Alphaproteobacteria bacterium]|nr:methyltransferase domain-containing protein [Alphaproteobacteria bacterium]